MSTKLGMDETSKKGHGYITAFVNLDNSKAVFVAGGKGHAAVDRLALDFASHNGDCGKTGVAACGMSLGLKAGMTTHFTSAVAIMDEFHVVRHANEAIGKVRREEAGENGLPRNTRHVRLHKRNGGLCAGT